MRGSVAGVRKEAESLALTGLTVFTPAGPALPMFMGIAELKESDTLKVLPCIKPNTTEKPNKINKAQTPYYKHNI
jgi:hypothetical protein